MPEDTTLRMTRGRWRQLETLYLAALALTPTERIAMLERADPELRACEAITHRDLRRWCQNESFAAI